MSHIFLFQDDVLAIITDRLDKKGTDDDRDSLDVQQEPDDLLR